MEKHKAQFVGAVVAGAALFLAGNAEVAADDAGTAKLGGPARVHLVHGALAGPAVNADLTSAGRRVALAQLLAPGRAGPVVQANAGYWTLKVAGAGGALRLERRLRLSPDRGYCIGLVPLARGTGVVVSATGVPADAMSKACRLSLARWMK